MGYVLVYNSLCFMATCKRIQFAIALQCITIMAHAWIILLQWRYSPIIAIPAIIVSYKRKLNFTLLTSGCHVQRLHTMHICDIRILYVARSHVVLQIEFCKMVLLFK